jgi:hypothetical protein
MMFDPGLTSFEIRRRCRRPCEKRSCAEPYGSSPLQTNIKYPPRRGNIMEDYAKQYFFKVCHEAVTNRQALADQQVRASLDIVVRSCFFRNDRPMISHHAP